MLSSSSVALQLLSLWVVLIAGGVKLNQINAESVFLSWNEGSQEELKAASSLAGIGLYSQAHFHLHLAVEKRLKALIVKKTQTHAPYSHNLSYLMGKLDSEPTEEQLESLSVVSEFNLSGRYPSEKAKLRIPLNRDSWEKWHPFVLEFLQWLK